MVKNVLGRGLDALIPGEPRIEEGPDLHQLVIKIPLSKIRPNPHQPRHKIDPASIDELAQSFKTNGILQPILVKPVENDQYVVIAGERRYSAAKKAEWQEIPAVIHNIPEGKELEIALVENIQRENLNPIEESMAYQKLMEQLVISQDQLASLVGKKRSTIANSLRLLRLAPEIKDAVSSGQIAGGHARAILSLPEDRHRRELFQKIILDSLSVREAEREAKKLLDSPAPPPLEAKRRSRRSADCPGRAFETPVSNQGKNKVFQ
ncbi:MAG: ParB/RepB/Spo0J family partition protein [bacterium]